jgi:hypothetical protein
MEPVLWLLLSAGRALVFFASRPLTGRVYCAPLRQWAAWGMMGDMKDRTGETYRLIRRCGLVPAESCLSGFFGFGIY